MRYAMPADTHARIFGPKDDLGDEAIGRSRKCKSCGGWHSTSKPWPHNCRKPAPPRNPNLTTPQLAPSFQPFKTGVMETAEVISSRNEKRAYMERNDLVEHDEGVGVKNEWVEAHENERGLVSDIKRFIETDPLNIPPDLKVQEHVGDSGSLDEGTEISIDNLEVAK
jgi:hypothetical protein